MASDAVFGGVLSLAAVAAMVYQGLCMYREGSMSRKRGGTFVVAFGWWLQGTGWLFFPHAGTETRMGILLVSAVCIFGGLAIFGMGKRDERIARERSVSPR